MNNDKLNLPKTSFNLKADLVNNEPKLLSAVLEETANLIEETPEFVLHDGPPYANGNIHIGHAYNKIIKDFIVRFQTKVANKKTSFIPGWDCHGLPIEQKAAEVKTGNLLDNCRKTANSYSKIQRTSFERLGVVFTPNSEYKTMDSSYEDFEYHSLKKLHEEGLIVKKLRPVYWCFKHQTTLAEAELEYQEVEDLSCYFMLPTSQENLFLVCWTTTPWTIPANQAVGFGNITYCTAQLNGKNVLVSEFYAKKLGLEFNKLSLEELKSLTYTNPFSGKTNKLIDYGNELKEETGTGLVHLAPAHGEEDYTSCKANNIEIEEIALNKFGKSSFFQTSFVETNDKVVSWLKENNLFVSEDNNKHDYPHCWRCKSKVVSLPLNQTFLCYEKELPLLLSEAEKIKFVPAAGKTRFLGFLKNRKEWCLSRQRTWGVPIPYFNCLDCNKENQFDNTLTSNVLETWKSEEYKPTCFCCASQNTQKSQDILDVWFDSGLSFHITKKEELDVIVEGSDQHRGWFQSLHILSTLLNKKTCLKTVITHGFVCDEKGKKMSKSEGNVISPEDMFKKSGADILRLWAFSQTLESDPKLGNQILDGVSTSYRKIRNNVRFLLGNLYDFPANQSFEVDEEPLIKMNTLLQEFEEVMTQTYNTSKFYSLLNKFNDELSSGYYDDSKKSLYESEANSPERRKIQATFYKLLQGYMKIVEVVLPFTAQDVKNNTRAKLLK